MNSKVTSNSIKDMLDQVQADREARKVFLAMPREEQLLAILGMIAFNNSQLASLQKEVIADREASKQYREQREQREKQLADLLDTDPQIKAMSSDEKQSTVQKIIALATRPVKGGGLLDKVVSLLVLILFWMLMTGKISVP